MYFPDTQVLIDFRRQKVVRDKLTSLAEQFVIAPPVITEIIRGLIQTNGETFENDREIFKWMRRCRILDLPLPFTAKLLHSTYGATGVRPIDYEQVRDFAIDSKDFKD